MARRCTPECPAIYATYAIYVPPMVSPIRVWMRV